jgi:hypothetical protein
MNRAIIIKESPQRTLSGYHVHSKDEKATAAQLAALGEKLNPLD